MNDPIVEEVRKIRDAHAAEFNYDLDAIFRDIKRREKESGRDYVPVTPTIPVASIPASRDLAPKTTGPAL